MNRDIYISKRQKFCKIANENPKNAADLLKDYAIGLENCRTTSDIITALAEIFAVSERTIERDLTTS